MSQLTREDGARVHHDVTGSGEDVVLLHGIGSTARSFGPLVAHLSPTYRCFSIDLRGYGDSGDEPVASGWDTFAEDVAAVLDARSVTRAHLVAASAGTLTALTLCRRRPERVRSLTLIGPTLGDAADPAEAARRLAERRVALTETGAGSERRAARMAGPGVSAAAFALLRSEQARIRPAGYGVVAQLLAGTDASAWLPALRVPTTVLAGLADAVTGPPVAEQVCRLLPGAGLVTMPDVGHSPHVEAPGATAAILLEWLARSDPQALSGDLDALHP